MAFKTFLAMTAGEFFGKNPLPETPAWMACHFSPYGRGLSNLPKNLPAGSLLILNDRIPIHGHDPEEIANQLQVTLSRLDCRGLLLDFQRPNNRETAQLVQYLSNELRTTLAVSQGYAECSDAPVFLPPLPHHVPLKEYTMPWQGRGLWLELALDGEMIKLTREGNESMPLSHAQFPEHGHQEEKLHCHYLTTIREDSVEFTLWRTPEDLQDLLREAELLGIANTVGLYQELAFLGWAHGVSEEVG